MGKYFSEYFDETISNNKTKISHLYKRFKLRRIE